jgi:hypothetical protein
MRKFLLTTAVALCALGPGGGAFAQAAVPGAAAPGAAITPNPALGPPPAPNVSFAVGGIGQPPAGASTNSVLTKESGSR